MKIIVQPEAGAVPVVAAIKQAKKSVDILIFRLDRRDCAEGLAAAVKRGVVVRALIAHTNRGGEKSLRKLEMRLLEAGVTVARTADDLVRYHGKLMIIDRRLLHLYGFNFTSLDIQHSRSFGVITRNNRFVDEAVKLFDADCGRHPSASSYDRFVVSPENSRERLTAFIAGARRQLLIYDPKVGDRRSCGSWSSARGRVSTSGSSGRSTEGSHSDSEKIPGSASTFGRWFATATGRFSVARACGN